MSGNPRWIYCKDGKSRRLRSYSSLLAEVLAAAANDSRERPIPQRVSADPDAARGRERVPAFVCQSQERVMRG